MEAADLERPKKYSVLKVVTMKHKVIVPYVLSFPTQNCGFRSNPRQSGHFSFRDVEIFPPHIKFMLHMHLLPQSTNTPNQQQQKKAHH